MEQEDSRLHASSRSDAVSETSSLSARSHSIRLSLDSSNHRVFVRTVSLGRIGGTDSRQHGFIRPNLIIQGISSEASILPGAVGDQAPVENNLRPGSHTRVGSRDSWRRTSLSFSGDHGSIDSVAHPEELMEKIDSSLAQVGCKGNRVDDKEAEGGLVTFSNDNLVLSFGSLQHEASLPSVVTPLTEEIVSPLPTDSMQPTKIEQYKLPLWLDYVSYLSHLAVFGILGVYTRYLLQKLFGPGLLRLTGDNNPLYLDLPSNMLGSFLMGWVGFVFKADILLVSEHLLVGLGTGYLGSLTTFSGWNQKMLESSSKSHWASAVAGIILGTFLVNYSIIVGVGCGSSLRRAIIKWHDKRSKCGLEKWRVDNRNKHVAILTTVLLIWCLLWVVSGELLRTKLADLSNSAVLWLAFLVGPPGVWIRWRLARLNGQGLGRKRVLKWLPIGTLLANVLAACIMAAVATISKAVNTRRCAIIVSGIQLGFLGCLSTVSTFAAEIYAMWKTGHGMRAFSYISVTIVSSFALGTLIFSVPVWTKNYD